MLVIFPPNLGASSTKTSGQIRKQMSTEKNGMDFFYPHAMFGGDRFTRGNVRMKIREFICFFFCLSRWA